MSITTLLFMLHLSNHLTDFHYISSKQEVKCIGCSKLTPELLQVKTENITGKTNKNVTRRGFQAMMNSQCKENMLMNVLKSNFLRKDGCN
jgi:hypothetical protein